MSIFLNFTMSNVQCHMSSASHIEDGHCDDVADKSPQQVEG